MFALTSLHSGPVSHTLPVHAIYRAKDPVWESWLSFSPPICIVSKRVEYVRDAASLGSGSSVVALRQDWRETHLWLGCVANETRRFSLKFLSYKIEDDINMCKPSLWYWFCWCTIHLQRVYPSSIQIVNPVIYTASPQSESLFHSHHSSRA